MIAEDAAMHIKAELIPGEEFLWADKPRSVPHSIFYWAAFFIIFLFVPFIGPIGYAVVTGDMMVFDSYTLSINEERVTSETPVASLWSAFISIIFMLLFFLAFNVGWLFLKMREIYGVTNRRAIIVSRFPQRRVSSINPAMTPYLERSGNEKIGSISFRGAEYGIVDKVLALYRVRPQSFTRIRNPRQVEALICERFIESHQ